MTISAPLPPRQLQTIENFGERQAETYAETLTLALEVLHEGPEPLGAKARDDIGPGIVLRLLHDSMDLARHVPPATDQSL